MAQVNKILDYFTSGHTLTAKQAKARFKIQRLSARISELRDEGLNIVSEPIIYRDTGAHGVKYYLVRAGKLPRV
jgi:biotin operon repressor